MALRDMSRKEFNAVLARRGWRKVLVWIDVGGGLNVGMAIRNGKINLRASIARAIRESSDTAR